VEQLLQPLGADELGDSGLTFVGGTHSGLTFGLTSERVLTGLTSERVLAGLTSERVWCFGLDLDLIQNQI